VRLRRNVAVQELTDTFVASREEAMKVAKEKLNAPSVEPSNERKRKRSDPASQEATSQPNTRRRSQRLRSNSQSLGDEEPPQEEVEFVAENHTGKDADGTYEPEDGLVPCPICHTRMKAEAVYGHLDTCTGEPPPNNKPLRTTKPPSRSRI